MIKAMRTLWSTSPVIIYLIGALFVVILALTGLYFYQLAQTRKQETAVATCNTKNEKLKGDISSALAAHEAAMRAKEREHQTAIGGLMATHTQETQHAQAELDSLRTARDRDQLRLRAKFVCPSSGRGTGTATTASTAPEEVRAGLSREDEEFLIRTASQYDSCARDYNTLRAVSEANIQLTQPKR